MSGSCQAQHCVEQDLETSSDLVKVNVVNWSCFPWDTEFAVGRLCVFLSWYSVNMKERRHLSLRRELKHMNYVHFNLCFIFLPPLYIFSSLFCFREYGQTKLLRVGGIPHFPPCNDDCHYRGPSQPLVYHQWHHWKQQRQAYGFPWMPFRGLLGNVTKNLKIRSRACC